MTSRFVFDFLKSDDILARGRKYGLAGTAAVWLVLLALGAFLPVFSRKPEYKTVHITLSSTPVLQTAEDLSKREEPSLQPRKKAAEQLPAAKQSTEKPSVQSASPAKPASHAAEMPASRSNREVQPVHEAPRRPTQYKKSVEDLMAAQQNASSGQKQEWNESAFEHASSTESAEQSSNSVKRIADAAALSGTSASAVRADGAVSSTAVSGRKESGTADASTTDALGKISAATYVQSSGNGVSAQTSVKSGSGADGKVALEMADGSSRTLLYPRKPVIQISDDNARTIDSSRTVTIQFTVFPDGSVPASQIMITPSSLLIPAIQKEIRDQISEWRFAQGASAGTARFEFSIIKK